MSGLAQILYDLKNEVRGCDVKDSLFCEEKLVEKGIIIDDFDNMNYQDSDVIIVGNVFINKYSFEQKEVLTYQEALSLISEKYYSIAVCGTHGKTTITNMIKHVLSTIFPISYLIGDGQGKAASNAKYFIFEACEHKEHFLSYHPNMIVCSNIDYDHVEYYKNKKTYKKTFYKFFENAKNVIIINNSIKYKNSSKSITYGENKSNIRADNIIFNEEGVLFSLFVNGKEYKNITLPIYGKHMLYDALACISCCYLLNVEVDTIIDRLKTYQSAKRRYNLTYINDNVIVDDYGHHPEEIKATIESIKQQFKNKDLYIIYHPDRPKRLTCFLYKYEKVFKQAKKTFILPFLNMDKEKENALKAIIDNKKIVLYNDKEFMKKYNNTVFLFTGSKEMKKQIKELIEKQKSPEN